jgi:GNAT superfamily N-acetyltransferase
MIERLIPPVSDSDVRALGELLVDAVDSGAAVSFLAPLTLERAEQWWRRTLAAVDAGAVVLVARDADRIVGTVQLHPAWAPNQPHRADVAKLIVDRRSRGIGIGVRLMESIEAAAHQAGFTLLTLDAKQGSAAARLYRRIGWTEVGVIPRYALDPDGKTPHGTIIFFKDLS